MRNLVRALSVGFLLGACAALPAAALEFETVAMEDGRSLLMVSGSFVHDEQLTPFLTAAGRGNISAVTFNSPGGNIVSAMKLGRMIRMLGLNTVQIRRAECASACSLAFAGGVARFAEAGSIGVHQSSFAPDSTANREQAVAGVQMMTAEILGYLKEMGVDSDLLSFSLKYGSDDIRYLSSSEMRELNLVTVGTPSATVDQAAPIASLGNQGQEEAAIDLVRSLVEGDPSLDVVAQLYASQVSYYGKPTILSEVLSDKLAYSNRWPERHYKIRPETVLATCVNAHCMVSGTYDWVVRSLKRNKQAKGVARFSYTISAVGDSKIVAEAGEVVRD